MRYINLHLLTYLLTYCPDGRGQCLWCNGWRWDSELSTSWQFLSTTVSMAWPHRALPTIFSTWRTSNGGPRLSASPAFVVDVRTRRSINTSAHRRWPRLSRGRGPCVEHSAGWSHLLVVAPGIQETAKDSIVRTELPNSCGRVWHSVYMYLLTLLERAFGFWVFLSGVPAVILIVHHLNQFV